MSGDTREKKLNAVFFFNLCVDTSLRYLDPSSLSSHVGLIPVEGDRSQRAHSTPSSVPERERERERGGERERERERERDRRDITPLEQQLFGEINMIHNEELHACFIDTGAGC